MNNKTNGTGNRPDKDDTEKVVRLPTLAERDRKAREERKAEAKRMKARRVANDVPFMNLNKITPFARYLTVSMLLVQIVFALFLDYPTRHDVFMTWGFVASDFTSGLANMSWYTPLTIFSHTLIHGSWMHLAFNIVMALALGILFERNFGTRTTAIFFFACAALGALFYLLLNPLSQMPLVGASGGVSGFFAATIMLLSERGQMGNLGRRGPWPVLGFWLAFMLLTGFLSGENVAWQAHMGGFLAGTGLYYGLSRGKIKF